MKKTRMTTKALSVLLTAVMLFTTISVGIILPDTKLEADAATTGETHTVTTIAQINTAIAAANTAGPDVVTTIKLGQNIQYNGSLASFTKITGNVLFDFNGYSLLMNYTIAEGRGSSGSSAAQLPSANSGRTDINDVDTFTNGMFMIGAGSTMQIINSKPGNICTMQVYTDFEDTSRGDYTAFGGGELHNYASSSLIYSEGTLIIGDMNNTSYNEFTLYAHSSVRNTNKDNPNMYYKKSANTNSYTVTINNSNAIFKMYGGTVQATAVSRARRNLWADVICYALNVNNCYSAEVYGGAINIPKCPVDNNNGISQCTGNASSGATARISAIRCNTPYLYLFDVDCAVQTQCGSDSSKDENLHTSCIYTTADANAPYVYGGNYSYSAYRAGGNSTATNNGWVVRGAYKLASSGTLTPSAVSGSNYGSTAVSAGNTGTGSVITYTVFIGDDETAENGIDMFSYANYRAYLAQHTSALDVYAGNTIMTTNGDATKQVGSTNYLRNGYTHSAWQGKTHPGTAYSTSYATPAAAGLNTSGGSLYLAPYWTENTYTITYDWNDSDGANKVSDTSSCPTTYKIDSTPEAKFGIPVRPGYAFVQWEVTERSYPATDTKQNVWSLATYPAGFSLNGKNGNITLKAHWKEVPYTATVDLNGGNIEGDTSDIELNYHVNKTFQFPTGVIKNYYTFDGYYKCVTGSGSWIANDTLYAAGDLTTVGAWGNPVFEAQFTPVTYDIVYNIDKGSAVDGDQYFTYNVEGKNAYTDSVVLPAITRTGYRFGGWYIEDANAVLNNNTWTGGTTLDDEGNVVPVLCYPAGTELKGKHGNVTLKAYWISLEYTVTLDVDETEGEYISGSTQLPYLFKSPLELNTPTRAGYTFKGWRVKSADAGSMWAAEIGKEYEPEFAGAKVILPAEKTGNVTLEPVWTPIEYTVTYNTNGSVYLDPFKFTIESVFNLPVITKNGYSFVQWTISEKEGNWAEKTSFSEGQQIKGMYGDVTLVAQWTEKDYVVTLNTNGGECSASALTYNVKGNTALPTPTRTGYDFVCWMVTSTGTKASWIIGDEYKLALTNVDKNGNYNYGDVTLTAQWTPTKYSIRFVSDGTDPTDIPYTIETDPFHLPASSFLGYRFVEWRVTAPAGNWGLNETIKTTDEIKGRYGDVTLVAVFEAIDYTITFRDIDGTTTTDTYSMKTTIDIPPYSADGYTFDGWVLADDVTHDGNWSHSMKYQPGQIEAGGLYGNVTLVPNLTPTEYVITFIPNGGTPFANIGYNITNVNSEVLPTPEKTGYDFAGWLVTDGDGNWEKDTVVSAGTSLTGKYGTVTLTAQWTPKKYTITWVTGNGTHTTEGTFGEMPSYDTVDTSKPADAEFTYTFTGWSPALSKVTGETTYTAQYSKTVNSYTVTWKYETSETSGYITETAEYDYGVHPIFNGGINPVKTSSDEDDHVYRFIGWADADGNLLTETTVVRGDITYTAQFKEVKAPRTVTWVINGVAQDTKWEVGETPVYVGVPVKPDNNGMKYTFSHWTPAITVVEADKDYRYEAVFTETAQTYTAIFDLNGGIYNGDTEISYNKTDGLLMLRPTKVGYTFAGWRVTANSGTWTDTDLLTYSSYRGQWGNVSFIAEYTANEYTIKVEADDGTTPEYKYTIESTDTLPILEKEGFVLSGWMIVSADGNWITGDTVSADMSLNGMYGDVTIHPVWTAKLYKITWISGDIIQVAEFRYGDTVIAYPPVAKAGYTAAWDSSVPNIMPAEDLTFTAVYTPIQYYLRFNAAGGSEVENFYYDTTLDMVLPTPTRDGATFKGWKVSAGNGSWVKGQVVDGGTTLKGTYGNATLTAQWELTIYTVTWVIDRENGISKVTRWYHGSMPSYDGTPYKAPDEYNSYVFAGWDREITVVTGNVEYEAQFTATERIYTVIWNVDGFTLTQNYKFGETPVYTGPAPTRPSTQEYDFTFSGWSPEVNTVSGDITYYAQFDVFTKILGLRVDKASVFLEIGKDAVVSAIIAPATATNKDIEWYSTNEDVVTIDEMGKVTAVGAGDALIYVQSKDGAYKSYSLVSVAPIITEYVIISAGGVSTTRLPGEAIQLTATVMPENATNKTVKWTSSNTSVARVDESGLVIFGDVVGTAIITATTDGYATGSIEVSTTTNSDEITDSVKTYTVMFAKSTSSYIIAGNTYDSINVVYKEGDTVEFMLTEPHFATANGVKLEREKDGVFRIHNISKNYSIMSVERADLGLNEDTNDNNDPDELSFFDKLKAFFKSIVDFFRGLFGG